MDSIYAIVVITVVVGLNVASELRGLPVGAVSGKLVIVLLVGPEVGTTVGITMFAAAAALVVAATPTVVVLEIVDMLAVPVAGEFVCARVVGLVDSLVISVVCTDVVKDTELVLACEVVAVAVVAFVMNLWSVAKCQALAGPVQQRFSTPKDSFVPAVRPVPPTCTPPNCQYAQSRPPCAPSGPCSFAYACHNSTQARCELLAKPCPKPNSLTQTGDMPLRGKCPQELSNFLAYCGNASPKCSSLRYVIIDCRTPCRTSFE